MSDEDRIVLAAVAHAEANSPYRKWIIASIIAAAALSLIAVAALALGVRNISAQNASVACQGSLLENVSTQNAAGRDARAQLRAASQVLADATEAQSDDIAVLLEPNATADDRSAATRDFQAQGVLISQAWHSYVDASLKADTERDLSPTTFRC